MGLNMAKTVTLRLDDETYELIRTAASGERRSISNFIEYATLSYLTEEAFASEEEMTEIVKNQELLKALAQGKKDITQKKYTIVG